MFVVYPRPVIKRRVVTLLEDDRGGHRHASQGHGRQGINRQRPPVTVRPHSGRRQPSYSHGINGGHHRVQDPPPRVTRQTTVVRDGSSYNRGRADNRGGDHNHGSDDSDHGNGGKGDSGKNDKVARKNNDKRKNQREEKSGRGER